MSWKEHRVDDSFIPSRRGKKKTKLTDTKKKKNGSKPKADSRRRRREEDELLEPAGREKIHKNNASGSKSGQKNGQKRGNQKPGSRKKDYPVKNEKRGAKKKVRPIAEGSAPFDKQKKKVLDLLSDPRYVPMKTKEIAVLMGVPKNRTEDLQKILDALVEEGRIVISKKGRYQRSSGSGEILTGTFTAHPKGFGFVTVEGREDDFYISKDHRNGAVHMDEVEIETMPSDPDGKRQEAKVRSVLSHGISYVVGTYDKSEKFGFVVPDEKKIDFDIFIPEGADLHARDKEKVVCTIKDFGKKGKKPEGIITELLGLATDPGTDVLSIVKAMDIPTEFPEDVMEEVHRVAVPVSEEEIDRRMDLRDVPMITIDGDDSKDLDDAVSLRKDGENYILGVHIADVSQYVKENGALDKEALKRGTSVYLADRVIPMLPKELSNGICSLNQGENRLALSCIMTVSPEGRVIDHLITETVVNINHRMTYHKVKQILIDRDEEVRNEYADIVPMLEDMLKVSKAIRKDRHNRGCIDFDFPEYKIVLDENGRPVDIVPEEHSEANELVEDFMILANETVAKEYCTKGLPFLYRIHDEPDKDRIHDLSVMLENFGVTLHKGDGDVTPLEVQEMLSQVKGRPEEGLINMMTLRSMQQAKYSPECIGHFGLALKYYCHYTSPIRRYPDLQIHRIIKENLHKKLNESRIEHYRGILESVGQKTSELERRSTEAEREVDKLKKAEYMEAHIGEEYDGVITGVTAWGVYVQLPNSIEGLVHISTMKDDFYNFDETHYCLTGERTGKSFTMSQPVHIRVTESNPETRQIDFEFV